MMSQVAQKQDLSDPEVIRAFARRVGNERYLTALYLLTIADIRGTWPRVWNAWKGKLLEDLYRVTLRVLGGAHARPAAPRSRRASARRWCSWRCTPCPDAHKALWETLDVGYFMRHDASEIAWHAKQLAPCAHAVPIDRRPPVVRAGWRRSAKACRWWSTCRTSRTCSCASAAISTSVLQHPGCQGAHDRNGYALDTFQVVTTFVPEHYRDLISMVETGLAKTLTEAGPLPRAEQGPRVAPGAQLPDQAAHQPAPDEKAQRWLLSISASDRAGLLYSVARVLARPPSEPAAGQGHDPGRAGRGHVPDQRAGVPGAAGAAGDRDRAARGAGGA